MGSTEESKELPAWHGKAVMIGWAVNTVALLAVVVYVASRTHFFPVTPNRSKFWPWASCFDDVCTVPECCSQFLIDEYSFTHYNHGFYLFPLVFTIPLRLWVFPRYGAACDPTSFDWIGFHISAFLEIFWEGFENSAWVINKFRDTSAPDYEGDSGMNVVGDLMVCMLGYVTIEAIFNQSFTRCGWKVYLGAIFTHLVLIEGLFWLWVCDGLFIIWVNLSGLAVISLCGPNNYYLYLVLGWVVVIAGWVAPLVRKQRGCEQGWARGHVGSLEVIWN